MVTQDQGQTVAAAGELVWEKYVPYPFSRSGNETKTKHYITMWKPVIWLFALVVLIALSGAIYGVFSHQPLKYTEYVDNLKW